MSEILKNISIKIKMILDNTEETVKKNFTKNHTEEEVNEIINFCKSTVIEILSVIQPSLNQLSEIVSEQSVFTNELEEKIEKFKQNFHDFNSIKNGDIVKDLQNNIGRVEKIIPNLINEDSIVYYGNKRAQKRKDLKKVTEHQEIIDYLLNN